MDAGATTPNKSNSLLRNAFSSPASGDGCCSTLLVGGDREFNVTRFEKFIKTTEFAKVGLSYAVVAIIGPQSSGKSTLLNQLFQTNFKEMDAVKRRSRTTEGIWVAKCPTIHRFTFVMDMEGTDGQERGEDRAFEKQNTLFALAVADVVLINMWYHDIGREQASNKPLLNTVFQVMKRLFGPRKTTLIFVIRDKKKKTPLESLDRKLRNDIQKQIEESAPKPDAHKETPLSEFFNVEVVALSSYEDKEDTFKEEVACMRQKFFNHNKLAGDRQAASGFSLSLQEIWEKIKKDSDLDLPSIKEPRVPVPPQLNPDPSHEHSQNDGAKRKHSTRCCSFINVTGYIFNATNSTGVGILGSMNEFPKEGPNAEKAKRCWSEFFWPRRQN